MFLCQEPNDDELVRAAAAALSVAAYHEANAVRMCELAPDLIPVVVGLLSNVDSEIQAHAATTLANIAYGSPKHQGDAGEAGAIEGLLRVCQGRAGQVVDKTFTNQDQDKLREHTKEDQEEVTREWTEVMKRSIFRERSDQNNMEESKTSGEALEGSTEDRDSPWLRAQIELGEEGLLEMMDVDAIQAATAALANLLCFCDANSVRLMEAGGLRVLVGLISSYRSQNLLDSDQVGVMCFI